MKKSIKCVGVIPDKAKAEVRKIRQIAKFLSDGIETGIRDSETDRLAVKYLRKYAATKLRIAEERDWVTWKSTPNDEDGIVCMDCAKAIIDNIEFGFMNKSRMKKESR